MGTETTTVEIKHPSGAVLFSAEISVSVEERFRVRAVLELAVKARANLDGANLARANLAGAYLDGANLDGANLDGANLDGAYLACAYLDGANLAGANLARAYLAGAYLAGAYLDGAYLAGAYLDGANLAGANLARAYLDGANLDGANLARANLSGAYLDGANLAGANLDGGEKLTGERPIFQIGPIGSRCAYFVAYITDKGLRLRAGCFFGAREEFEEKLSGSHGDNKHATEYRAALTLIDAHVSIWEPKIETKTEGDD